MNNASILLISRILMGLIFVMAGIGKLQDVSGFAGFMASGGIPGFLAWPVILFEIIGGIALIIGFQTRWIALALAAFCVATGVMFHFDPSNQMQMTSMFKNLAMAGGYLALYVSGPGRLSLDARREN